MNRFSRFTYLVIKFTRYSKGLRTETTLKGVNEHSKPLSHWQIQGISRVYWYEATALCDKEITLPERVRIDLNAKVIALLSRSEEAPRSSSEFRSCHCIPTELSLQRVILWYMFKGSVPAEYFVMHCIAFPCPVAHCVALRFGHVKTSLLGNSRCAEIVEKFSRFLSFCANSWIFFGIIDSLTPVCVVRH